MSKSAKHMNISVRMLIFKYLNENYSFHRIAKIIGYNVSSVSREVRSHRYFKQGNYYNGHPAPCKDSRLQKAPWVCNGCKNWKTCRKDKYVYLPEKAQADHEQAVAGVRQSLQPCSNGIQYLNSILTPAIKENGQTVSHVFASYGDHLGISRSTLYRYIDKGILEVRNVDLPNRVRFKLKQKSNRKKTADRKDPSNRVNRTYLDFLAYSSKNPGANIVEIDSVIGTVGDDQKVLCTMLFRDSNFMMAFLRERNDAQSIVDIFDRLEKKLGKRAFANMFSIVLGDNGSEFSKVNQLEANDRPTQRCHFFYCDARASQQKGKLEKNHQYIRKYYPQGTSLNELTQNDVDTMMNHINSTKRDSLGGKSPFECLSKELLNSIIKLGYCEIDASKVILKPSLLKKK